MGVAVLGPLAVDGTTARLRHHDRVVLTVLAMRPGETVAADRLADALWGEQVPETWDKVVQGCVVRLRKALGAGAIETTPHGYRLKLPADEIDTLRFEHLVGRGRELLALAEPDRAAFLLDEAVALWRGPALAELDGWEGSRAEITRLDELRRNAEELSLDAALKAGRAAEVLGRARQLVDEAPLRERRWVLLALAQYQAGLQAEALRTLRGVRTLLATELGVDPGPELMALEQAILRQDPGLAVTAAAPEPSASCPYRGLVPFGVSDSETFFGREHELGACLRQLEEHGVLAVVGASGSGKSSLVRAGVAAALTRTGRRVRVVSPGSHPLDVLEGMPQRGTRPVLLVDQCEEAVTLCESAAEQAEFFDRLAAHADEAPLVVALRADQVGPMSTYPAFARLLQRGFQLLGPMGADQLRACIVRPAEQSGLIIEPGLVELLLRELEDEPGALPLLSHALRETWFQREGRTLTVAGYHASGGIRGAVARTADEVHDELPEQDRPLLRDLMMRLVTSAPDGQLVRTRVPRRILVPEGGDETRAAILERLVTARLLVSDGDEVEIAHEALIRAWPRLRQWLEEDAEGRRILQHLAVAADTWNSMDRPGSELYRGVRLAQALDWHRQSDPDLAAVEQDFLAASRALVDAELEEARGRARHEREARRRTRRLATGLAAALALALVAAAGATVFQQSASERAAEADANRLAALSKSVSGIDLSLLLAVEALRTADTPATRDGLLTAVLDHGRAQRVIRIGNLTGSGALADRGRTLFVNANSQLFSWQVGSTAPPQVILRWGNTGDVLAGAPTDDLVALARWTDDDTPVVGVFDSRGQEQLLLEGVAEVGGVPLAFGFSPDSRRLYLGVFTEQGPGPHGVHLREFDLGSGELVRDELVQRQPASRPWMSVAMSEDGAWSVSYQEDDLRNAVLVKNRTGGRVPLTLPRRPAQPGSFLPLPTGTALGWDDGAVSLYDATGRQTQLLEAHRTGIDDVVVARDGSWGAIGDGSGLVTVWDIDERSGTWSPRETLRGLEGKVRLSVGEGSTLVSVSGDGTVVVWDLSPDAGLGTPLPGLGARGWISNTPATIVPGHLVVAPTRDGPGRAPFWTHNRVSATFLDPRTAEVVDQVQVGENQGSLFASSVSVSPDRSLVAVTHQVGTVVLDARTRDEVARIELDEMTAFGERMPENVWCSAWTPDGSKLLLCAEGEEFDAEDGNLVVVDTDTWEVADERVDVGGSVQTAELSPDGTLLALGMVLQLVDEAPPGMVKILDAQSLEVVEEIDLGTDQYPFDVSFSPDGRRLAVGVDAGLLFVADVETGELLREPASAHSGSVTQVEWLPDNRTVVSTGFDMDVTLYDSERGLVRASMRVAVGDVDDGHTYLLAADEDQVGALTRQTPGRTYPLDPDLWLDRACDIVERDLTRDEWASYLPDRDYRRTCGDRT